MFLRYWLCIGLLSHLSWQALSSLNCHNFPGLLVKIIQFCLHSVDDSSRVSDDRYCLFVEGFDGSATIKHGFEIFAHSFEAFYCDLKFDLGMFDVISFVTVLNVKPFDCVAVG